MIKLHRGYIGLFEMVARDGKTTPAERVRMMASADMHDRGETTDAEFAGQLRDLIGLVQRKGRLGGSEAMIYEALTDLSDRMSADHI